MTTEYSLQGKAVPPMLNGELVFDAPWQGRVFGIARGMAENGTYAWDEFRDRLIAQIGTWDRHVAAAVRAGEAVPEYRYYDHFLAALETLLGERGIVAPGELAARTHAFAARPDGHDHMHPHDHDHAHLHDHEHAHPHDDGQSASDARARAQDDRDGHADSGAPMKPRKVTRVEFKELSLAEISALLDRDVSACLAFVDPNGFPR